MNRHNDKNIKDVLQLFIHSNKKLEEGYQSTIIEDVWKNKMGNAIASYTTKIQLKEGTLYITLSSAPLRKELMMGKTKIIDLMNEALEGHFVKEVLFY
jgi:hypothetical protein